MKQLPLNLEPIDLEPIKGKLYKSKLSGVIWMYVGNEEPQWENYYKFLTLQENAVYVSPNRYLPKHLFSKLFIEVKK